MSGLAERKRELEALFHTLHPKLVGYFQRNGRSEAVARELAQDTFFNALRGLDKFKGDSKLSTWVWSIALNVLRAQVRVHEFDIAHDADGPLDPDTLTSGDTAHLRDQQDCIRRGFAAFAADHPERAQVIYLAVVEAFTREELAAHLGRSVHAATEYLSQCKAKLRPYLQDCHDD